MATSVRIVTIPFAIQNLDRLMQVPPGVFLIHVYETGLHWPKVTKKAMIVYTTMTPWMIHEIQQNLCPGKMRQ